MIYHQLQSEKKERRRNICMSLMISNKLLRLIGTLDYYVHIPPMLEKTPKRNEKNEEFLCAHEILRQFLRSWDLEQYRDLGRQLVLHFIFGFRVGLSV